MFIANCFKIHINKNHISFFIDGGNNYNSMSYMKIMKTPIDNVLLLNVAQLVK